MNSETAPRGGSYIRDPETGTLTLVEETLPEAPTAADDAAPAGKKKKAAADPASANETDGGNGQ
jgi:hypothetical protein